MTEGGKHERCASIHIDLIDVRSSVVECLLWAGEGHNAPRAKLAVEDNIWLV